MSALGAKALSNVKKNGKIFIIFYPIVTDSEHSKRPAFITASQLSDFYVTIVHYSMNDVPRKIKCRRLTS